MNRADLKLTDEEIIEAAGWKHDGWEDLLPLDDDFSTGPVTGAELRAIAKAATDKALRLVAEWWKAEALIIGIKSMEGVDQLTAEVIGAKAIAYRNLAEELEALAKE